MDFNKIINDISDDKNFIIEIIYDLLEEGKECYENMISNLKIYDFNKLIIFAHKIKGSALYLQCSDLTTCSKNLEKLGKDALKINGVKEINEINEIKKEIEYWLDKYDNALYHIKKELLSFEKNYKK